MEEKGEKIVYYKLAGKNVIETNDMLDWAKWMETGNWIVKQETLKDSRISTVFLGLDHSFCGGVPLLFETMVFGGKLDQEMDRYSTYEQAEKGHQAMVERVKFESLGQAVTHG
jgi:hypothetical protein